MNAHKRKQLVKYIYTKFIVYGKGEEGDKDGRCTEAQFSRPNGVCVDAEGNIYVADTDNDKIKRIDAVGNVTTVAGSGRDRPMSGSFRQPYSVAVQGGEGKALIVGDISGVRKISGQQMVQIHSNLHRVSGLAVTGQATFVGVDNGGSCLFVSEKNCVEQFYDGLHRVGSPWGVTVDAEGNILYTDCVNHRVSKIDLSKKHVVSPICGGPKSGYVDGLHNQSFNLPHGIVTDKQGNILLTDSENDALRIIDRRRGFVSTIQVESYEFNYPVGIAIKDNGNLIISDSYSHRVIELVNEGYHLLNWPKCHLSLTDPIQDTVESMLICLCLMRVPVPRDILKIVVKMIVFISENINLI